MYEVIKEFAGIKEGEKKNFTDNDAKYLTEAGYIKPIEAKVEPSARGRKKKVELEAEKLLKK